jgi:hypothetical protein
MPEGVILVNFTVRNYEMEKELECCIDGADLISCNKKLRPRFPDFNYNVIEMLKKNKLI